LERSPDRPPFGPFWTSLFVGHGNTGWCKLHQRAFCSVFLDP
jgi:hypothetical protein